jgi:peptide/nickel transport system substrate-binding protein
MRTELAGTTVPERPLDPRARGRRRRLGLRGPALLGALLAALTLAACGGSDGDSGGSSARGTSEGAEQGPWGVSLRTDGTPARGGTLVVDQYRAPLSISAYRMMERPDTPSFQVGAQVFNQLVEYHPGEFDPQPGLARSWEISDDGLTYTFHLQPGVRFSNGMPFTSEDVKFTLDHARGEQSFFRDTLYGVIRQIEMPDPQTAVVHLSRVSPGFLYALGNIAASIVPAQLVERVGAEAYNRRPVGTGPFMVDRWVKDQEVVLVRNPDYWREGRPYLDEVRLRATPNDNTRVLNVTSGTSDVADTVPFAQIASITRGGDADVLVGAGGDMFALWTNNQEAPLDDPLVRQALAYATPRENINDVAFGGVATLMNSIYPKLKYWDESVEGYAYDPARARALLARSSVPDGFETTLRVVGTDQPSNQIAQIVQQAWKEIGVDVQIARLDDATLQTAWAEGKHDITLHTPGSFATDVPVEDEFALLLFDSPATNNLFTFVRDPTSQRLTREATTTLDEAERTRLFSELQRASLEALPVIPLTYTPNRAAVGRDVDGFNYLMAGSYWRLEYVSKG